MNDQLLIEQAYRKIYENKSVLIPRRSAEERQKNYQIALKKKVKEYIKNGSKGNLDLTGTPITSLPEGLIVGGNLNLTMTRITSLPEGLIVGGDLNLNSTRITRLPEGLKVDRDLNLYNTPITSLPEGLTVRGNLYLTFSRIKSLPKKLNVGGDLFLTATSFSEKYSIEQLKQMLPNVKGEIFK